MQGIEAYMGRMVSLKKLHATNLLDDEELEATAEALQ